MTGIKTLSVSIIVILCCAPYLLCKEGVSYKLSRTLCNTFNPKFINKTYCRVRHINRTAQLINVEINIQPNVSISNIRIDGTSYFKFRTEYRPSLIKYSEFICDALNNGTFSHFFHMVGMMYAKSTNLLERCPRSGKIYAKNMLIDTSNLPQFIPVGEYRFDTKIYTYMSGEEEFVLLIQDYIEVKALGIERF